jgi:site-specific DNA recombinase
MPAVNRTRHPDAVIYAAIYARVSKEEPTDQPGFSLPSQIGECLRYAEMYGIQVRPEHIFQDDFTGKVASRPALDQLHAVLEAGEVQAVIVARIDRLGRSNYDQVVFFKKLEQCGVALYHVGCAPGQKSRDYNLLVGMLSLFSEFEHALILEKLEQGRRERARKGYPRRQKVTYGYRWVEELLPDGRQYEQAKAHRQARGHYVIEPEEAAIIQLIFHWYVVDGWPAYKIAQELTARSIPTMSSTKGYKRRQPALLCWGRSSVHHILRNGDYLGTQIYGKRTVATRKPNGKPARMALTPEETWIPVMIPALIEPELFAKAQERGEWNKRYAQKNRKHTYLFGQGRITCGICGIGMGGTTNQGRMYYRCNSQPITPGICHRQMSGKKLEALVWREIKARFSDPHKAMELFYQETPGGQPVKLSALREEKERLEKAHRQAGLKLQRLEDAYYDGTESREEYAAKKKKFTKEQDLTATQLQILRMQEQQDSQLQEHRAEHEQILEIIAEELACMETLEEKIHVLNLLRLRIEYLPDKRIKIRVQPFAPLGKNVAVVTRLDQQYNW